MKHVELHAYYFTQLFHENVVSLKYCKKNDMFVDIFTKPLTEAIFIKLCMMLEFKKLKLSGGRWVL
jgi:hypothetical protein